MRLIHAVSLVRVQASLPGSQRYLIKIEGSDLRSESRHPYQILFMGGKIKKAFQKFRHTKIKTWMLILLLLPLGLLDATLLRNDHIRMTELRDAILATDDQITESLTDTESDQIDTELAQKLIALKEFVFSHIVVNVVEENGEQRVTFGTGPFYLEHQYLRAAHRALDEAEKTLASDANPNGNIYGAAGATCRALAIANGWTWDNANFINCMVSEINKYPSAAEIQDTIIASLPSTELYRHNYASPVWAPTPAGFFLLLTGVVIVVIFIRFITWLFLRLSLLFI